MRLSREARRAGVTALISVVSAILGGSLTAVVTVVTQDEEFEELRASESRDKRAQVYREFLVRAERFRTESEAVPEECARQLVAHPNQPCNPSGFIRALQSYQRSINEVYIFGSDDAVEAEGEVSALLPPSLSPFPRILGSATSMTSHSATPTRASFRSCVRSSPPNRDPGC